MSAREPHAASVEERQRDGCPVCGGPCTDERCQCDPEPLEVFRAADVRVGDVIRYPAILRREHRGWRGDRIVVAGIDHRGLRCIQNVNGEKRESFVVPAQIEENGVIVEAHVGD